MKLGETISKSISLNNLEISVETGKIAKQANTAILRCGDLVILASAVGTTKPKEGLDFFPLLIDYREKYYSSGKIAGGYIKREGRPSDNEIITARTIDRPIRPLFPQGYKNETSVNILLLSNAEEYDADVFALNAASCALAISDIPFKGPVGCVRVGKIDGELILFPTKSQLEVSKLNIVVAGTSKAVTMVESIAYELSEDEMLEAIEFAHENVKKLVALQEELVAVAGKKKFEYTFERNENLYNAISEKYTSELAEALNTALKDERGANVKAVKTKAKEEFASSDLSTEGSFKGDFADGWERLQEKLMRAMILDNKRVDGRATDEIRDILVDVDFLPRTHGSCVFTRGETQSLVTSTLGTVDDGQRVETVTASTVENFMLHYNFPPYCVGEVGAPRGTGRRELGHGNLAKKALIPVMPKLDDFPYTIRIVSEIMESNGSSSMASICGGTMSLMDAGVPISNPVAGIAMGLIKEEDKYTILSDILGDEDHYGDLDFKVAGTQNGITALQMDIKIEGLTFDIMKDALAQAKVGRIHILKEMMKPLSAPRAEIAEDAPRVVKMKINPDKIGKLIGPGGKTIRELQETNKCEISIADDGVITLSAGNQEDIEQSVQAIEDLVCEPVVGKIYQSTVKAIKDFGIFVEFMPKNEGLVHISELPNDMIKDMKIGDSIAVKLNGFDFHGRAKLVHKELLEAAEEEVAVKE
ncbi:MAG: polyribonucleotide nucleotidyltransferase [Planctomycetota bacterium]|nr:MAG: polyribonucleotide nucleotidyltransferase [Planctomycetota bacterium]